MLVCWGRLPSRNKSLSNLLWSQVICRSMCIKPLHVGRVAHSNLYNSNEPPAVQHSVQSQKWSDKSRIWTQMKGCSMVLQGSRWKQLRISLIWRFNWESWAAGGHETRAWLTINQRVKGRLSERRGCNQEILLIGKVNRAGWRTLIFCFFSELLNAEPQVCCLHLHSVTPSCYRRTPCCRRKAWRV